MRQTQVRAAGRPPAEQAAAAAAVAAPANGPRRVILVEVFLIVLFLLFPGSLPPADEPSNQPYVHLHI